MLNIDTLTVCKNRRCVFMYNRGKEKREDKENEGGRRGEDKGNERERKCLIQKDKRSK